MSPRAGLDRATVVRKAAELADQAGEEVTMAALATNLGVRTPSLYNHVAGQEALRRELALLALRELQSTLTRAAVAKTADEALLAVSHAYRGFARSHPGIYPLTLQPPDPEDAETSAVAAEIVDLLSTVVASYGLTDDDSIHAIRGLRSLLHGFVTLEAAGGFGIPLDLDESFDRSVLTFIQGLQETTNGRAC